jgi:hypothetical protein
MNRLDQARAKMLAIVGEQLVRHEMFTIDWQFSCRLGLSSASFDEMADPAPYDEAYPTLAEPVAVDLHRFLAVADGVVRAQGRKIIFATNLPNIGDIDEALARPGRCFATVRTRALERCEAASLLTRIAAARAERNEPERAAALAADMRSITLASLYRLMDAEG